LALALSPRTLTATTDVFVLTTSCDHGSHISGDPSGSLFLSKYLKTSNENLPTIL
jgi:hypothetical protein